MQTLRDRQPQNVEQLIYYVQQTFKDKKPENLEQLIHYVEQESNFSKEEILKRILVLEKENRICLRSETVYPSRTTNFAASRMSTWFWVTVAFTLFTAILVLWVPESYFSVAYVRPAAGSFFVLFLPGYAFVQAIFADKKFDAFQRIGACVGISVALVSLDAFILNFSPLEITLTSIVLTLTVLTLSLATAAILIQFSRYRKAARAMK